MCGIIGYTGDENCLPILKEGLRMLEYRGYDSAGVAFFESGEIEKVKSCGKLAKLEEKLDSAPFTSSSCGIGHTRWATHGAPSDTNSHPHSTSNLSLVHNGIIENHKQIEAILLKDGYTFESDTDTERACKLIDKFFSECGEPRKALLRATELLQGSFAFAAIFKGFEGKIFAIRRESPLVLATDERGAYLASDIPALLPYSKRYFRLPEARVAVLDGSKITVYDSSLTPCEVEYETANWSIEEAKKGGFAHFMLKEINEEPEALQKTVELRIENSLPHFGADFIPDSLLQTFKHIRIVACGTAMHAGLVGKYIIEKLARIHTEVEIASEFRYRSPVMPKDSLCILLSQSGETADTLASLRYARDCGIPTLGIVNVYGSTLAREADYVLYTQAGPEIAVASTKAYSVQCALMYLIATKLAILSNEMSDADAKELCDKLLHTLPKAIDRVLALDAGICAISKRIKDSEHLFYIGRGADYHLAVEASLKLKEISYIHSEAYAAGELKHGTISLITDGTPVVCIMTEECLAQKTAGGINEVLSRGAEVFVICTEKTLHHVQSIKEENKIILPDTDALLYPFLTATATQLLAYHTSALKGLDVDKPRNLAKSVTVE